LPPAPGCCVGGRSRTGVQAASWLNLDRRRRVLPPMRILKALGRSRRPSRPSLVTLCVTDSGAGERRRRRVPPQRRRPALLRRGSPIAAVGLCVLVGAAGALAATHGLNPDFAAFLGGGKPPGRVLSPAETPDWIKDDVKGRASAFAEAGHHRLIAYNIGPGSICFDYDGHVIECSGPRPWRRGLARHPVILRGPTLSQSPEQSVHTTRGNLYGFVDGSVAEARLEYPDGSFRLASAATGAFLVPIDLARHPARLVALGAAGEVVVSIDISESMNEELEIVEEEMQRRKNAGG
jgi:hypothetical protein